MLYCPVIIVWSSSPVHRYWFNICKFLRARYNEFSYNSFLHVGSTGVGIFLRLTANCCFEPTCILHPTSLAALQYFKILYSFIECCIICIASKCGYLSSWRQVWKGYYKKHWPQWKAAFLIYISVVVAPFAITACRLSFRKSCSHSASFPPLLISRSLWHIIQLLTLSKAFAK